MRDWLRYRRRVILREKIPLCLFMLPTFWLLHEFLDITWLAYATYCAIALVLPANRPRREG